LKWTPALALFFSSILFQITTAAFSYFFSLRISWGATVKEQQNPTSWQVISGLCLWLLVVSVVRHIVLQPS
jgi:hypothetical protein